jgi:hypothetical protein
MSAAMINVGLMRETIPNSKRDGSYLRLRCRCCKGALRGTAAQMAKRASSSLLADNLD